MNLNLPEFKPQAVLLSSSKITLRPLTMEDAEGFFQAGNFAELWQWVEPNHCASLTTAKDWIRRSLEEQQNNNQFPFVIIDNESNCIIGSTRYCTIRHADRGIEIGYTFITPKFQRSYVNTHAKFLLLQHAFEQLGAIRVELKTHEKNQKSRNAISRIGAVFEGVMRNHRILSDGNIRSTALFSITEQEWPEVKSNLLLKIQPQLPEVI